METVLKILTAIARYLAAALLAPRKLDQIERNHLAHLGEEVAEIKTDVKQVIREQAVQKGICEATRRAALCPPRSPNP
jgi:hypothetical protein